MHWKNLPVLHPTPHAHRVASYLQQRGSHVHVYKTEELSTKELGVNTEGKIIHTHSKQLFNTQPHALHMYIMNNEGRIFTEPSHASNVYHISLDPSQKSTVAAGQIKSYNGNLYVIDEESGHFKPCGRVFYVLQRLVELGWKQPFSTVALASSEYYAKLR